MIKLANMWRSILLSLCILAVCSVDAQSLQRKVFSPGGSVFTHNGQEYGFTIGEPMIGTDLLTIPYLTKGFQQPEPIYLLAPEITLHQVRELEGVIQLSWSASHHEQTSQYRIEYAIEGGDFVLAEQTPFGSSSQSVFSIKNVFPEERIVKFRVVQVLNSGMLVTSNVIELWIGSSVSSWSIYPNPTTTDAVTISFGEPLEGPLHIEIFTQFGQLIRQERVEMNRVSQLSIETESLASGVYLVHLRHQEIQGVVRLIVER